MAGTEAGATITFIGNGAIIHKDKISDVFPNSNFIEGNANIGIGKAAYNSYSNNIFPTLSPLYLRKSQAERMLEEKKC